MSTTDSKSAYRAPALDKGLDILELLAQQPAGLTRGEIVKEMGRSPSEIYRMLERLVIREYVVRSVEGDRYSLSMKLFILSNCHPPLRRLVSHAQPCCGQLKLATSLEVNPNFSSAIIGDSPPLLACGR
ncbi:hypothetical protein DKT75_14140 [Leucothrix arctica]|uniref:HTH iclR-type domain-containing protein n=2 Tax=Leucothrix arctica TaxID=1481894 RepID=A0A317C8Z4_9GAMM|nr:helix-turn-helix domain-containing protein [Leucothrix arctica]PWQ94787.1 hypothetical protein DKT75_14140 [Leucothrix arctica]